MSRTFITASPDHVFADIREIESHLLGKLENKGGLIGTELELFVTTAEGTTPISFNQVENLLTAMAAQATDAQLVFEKDRAVALHIPSLGDVCLEPGGQVELSTRACKDLNDVAQVNLEFRALLDSAAHDLGLTVQGQGHMPAYFDAPDMPRSRFAAYYAYCRDQYGDKAEDLIKTMKSCCGLQVNFDPMGEDFHEIYRALLLVDVATSLTERSERQERLHKTYAVLSPEQLTPVFNTLAAHSNDAVISHVTERLLKIKVPFVPDRASPEGFRSTTEIYGHAPTIGELLGAGNLTTEILDNSLALQLTMPNLRRHGVMETRAPDSVHDQKTLMAVVQKYHRFAYDKAERKQLLDKFSGIDGAKLEVCFLSRFEQSAKSIEKYDLGAGVKAGDLMAYISRPLTYPKSSARPAGPR